MRTTPIEIFLDWRNENISLFEISRIISSFWGNNSCDRLHKYFDPIVRILFGLKPPDSRCSMSADLQFKQKRECLKGLRAKFWPKTHFDVVVFEIACCVFTLFLEDIFILHTYSLWYGSEGKWFWKWKKKSLNWSDFLVKNFAYSPSVHCIFSYYAQLAELYL